MDKLWNRNFTLITIGTVISMVGNQVSAFAISVLVLEYTNSTFLYALFLVIYNLPKAIAPILAGPYVDRFSRKKIIYMLDFISSGLYLFVFIILNTGYFNYLFFLILCLIIGCIDGTYTVAYDSLYPNLVTPNCYRQAYSIASLIYPIAAVMVPVASLTYARIGTVAPLFAINAVTFSLAAFMETKINVVEQQSNNDKKFNWSEYKQNFMGGINYIKKEKGLLVITVTFLILFFFGTGGDTMLLPFFRNHPEYFSSYSVDSITLYTIVLSCNVIGRFVGGVVHYLFKYPPKFKFTIATFVYIFTAILYIVAYYMPIPVMCAIFFLAGLLSVTSYNIRITSTQAYVPDEKRGRFNGIFYMGNAIGIMLGQLVAGSLAELIPERTVAVILLSIEAIVIAVYLLPNRNEVKKVYNRKI